MVWKMPRIEHNKPTEYGWTVLYPYKLELGINTDIGYGTLIQAQFGVEIRENVQIGGLCCIYSISTIDNKRGKIIIMEGAKIGCHSSIMPGVTIGKNATVGAHSLIKKDVPDNECVCTHNLKRRILPAKLYGGKNE